MLLQAGMAFPVALYSKSGFAHSMMFETFVRITLVCGTEIWQRARRGLLKELFLTLITLWGKHTV